MSCFIYILWGAGGGEGGCERRGVNKRGSSFQATGLMGTRPFNSGSSDEAGSRPKWRAGFDLTFLGLKVHLTTSVAPGDATLHTPFFPCSLHGGKAERESRGRKGRKGGKEREERERERREREREREERERERLID